MKRPTTGSTFGFFLWVTVSLAATTAFGDDDRWYDSAQRVSWGFTVENGVATISTPGFWDSNARDNCKGDIVVPSRIGPDGPNGAKTYPVRDMAPGLFRNCTKVTSVTLPDGIRRIAPNAFYFDRNSTITNVVIGEGCLDICENAFLRCEKLVSLNIPDTVTNIGENAVQLCKVLPRIDIPGSVKTIGDSAFAACYGLADVTFGDGIESIDADAFLNCSSLLAADLPASVRSIGDRAFYGCNQLASATLREGLEAIGNHAFNQCESLVSVSIPESVTWVGERAFQYCPDSIFDKTTVPGVCLLSGWAVGVDNPFGAIDLFGVNGVADGLFKDCRDVTSVVLPPGIETLGGSMFSGCRSLEAVGLPTALKSIEGYAFQSCQKIQAVNIPSGVTNIGQYAFAYCEKLANVTLPDGLAAMDDNAFEGCTNLTSVTIPASLKRIPMGAFQNCTSLTNVTVEEGVEVIGNASFYGCRALPAFTIPDSVKVVEDIAFGGCAFLDTNTIANVEMADGWIVGSSQPNLTEVTVPGDVRGISECAFSYRNNLTNAVVQEGVTVIPFQAFAFDAKLTDVALPVSLVEIGKQVFCGCRSLVSIYVPSNVVAIGEEAFASCPSLETVYLPIALKGKVNEASLVNGSGPVVNGNFSAKIVYYRADGTLDNEKRVAFDPNGGELAGADTSRDVKEGAAVGALPTPTWTKHKFLGWFTEKEGGEKVTATTKIQGNVTFYAHWEYLPLADVSLSVGGIEIGQGKAVSTNVTRGVALKWPVSAGVLSGVKVQVAGLPSGLKFTDKDIYKKGSKTEVEIPANTIYGVPGAASKADARTGLAMPSDVKITVSVAGKPSVTYALKLTVTPLPAWAVGTFKGDVAHDETDAGVATMTVTVAGKISGKVTLRGTSWAFKADSYAAANITADASNFVVAATATAGSSTRILSLDVAHLSTDYIPDSATSRAEGMFGTAVAELSRVPWTDKGDSAPAKYIAQYAGTYSCKVGYGKKKGTAAFAVDEKGNVKGSIILPSGTTTRKVSFSGSVLVRASSVYVTIYAPPDATKGYPAVFETRQLMGCSGPDNDSIAYRDPGVIATTAELNKGSGASGTVKVSPKYGQAAAGKTVTLTAKPADKNSVFSGWVIPAAYAEGIDLSNPTLKLQVDGVADIPVTANFVTVAEDRAIVRLIVGDEPLWNNGEGKANSVKRVDCGVAVDWPVQAVALSKATIKAAGLPPGLKLVLNKATGTYSISGVPTAASKIDAATRNPVSSKITLTATTAGKTVRTATLPVIVDALPTDIVGVYNGMVGGFADGSDENSWRAFGMVTFAIAANGKLSAKAVLPSGTRSFSVKGWDTASNGIYRVKMTAKSGDSFSIALDSRRDWRGARIAAPASVLETAKGARWLAVAWRNEHGKTGNIPKVKAASGLIAKIVALKKLCYVVSGNAAIGYTVKAVPVANRAANLTLTFATNGTVKYSGKIGGKSIGGTATLNIDDVDYFTIGDLAVPLSKTEALYLSLGFDCDESGEPQPDLAVFHVAE